MKKCTNPSCGHQLEDYQDRCPYCGRSQKVRNLSSLNIARPAPEPEPEPIAYEYKNRNKGVTIWLWFAVVVNIFVCVCDFNPKMAWGSDFPDSQMLLSYAGGVLSIANVVGTAMILCWKKSGFYILAATSVIGAAFSVFMSRFPMGLVGIVVWFIILQAKKNGKSCWEQLE